MSALQEVRPVEIRLDEESRRLSEVSVSTLEYMIVHGLAREQRLRHQRIDLGYFAEEEQDLLEAIRLSERLNRVERNISRTGRANERVRAELVGRGVRG